MFLPQTTSRLILPGEATMAHNQEVDNRRSKENESNRNSAARTLIQREWARFSRRGKTKKSNKAKKTTAMAEVDCEPCTLARADKVARDFDDWLSISDKGHQHYDGVDPIFDVSAVQKKRILQRGMDRLRRSFRKSFHRSKTKASLTLTPLAAAHNTEPVAAQSAAALASTKECGKKKSQNYCLLDEAAVRAAACSFHVKYLGACEVFDSKGLHICESALQHLRVKKQVARAILYVSGDGIRLVDQEKNHGLILDQTIEKVSFCAPDRFNDKGFAYICRDGASRRWMCHGFHAIKDSGERLSHAVGCAFTICLETKRKMDAEMAAYRSAQQLASTVATSALLPSGVSSITVNGKSFRKQYSLLERRLDPQIAKSITNMPTTDNCCDSSSTVTTTNIENGFETKSMLNKKPCSDDVSDIAMEVTTSLSLTLAKPRPTSNMQLFDRQGSFKAPIQSSSVNSFKRFNSLRGGVAGIGKSHHLYPTLHNEPIYEGDQYHTDTTETGGVHINAAHQSLADGGVFMRATAMNSKIRQSNLSNLSFPILDIATSTLPMLLAGEEPPQSSRADEWLNDVWRRSIMRPVPTTSRSTVFNGECQHPSSSRIAQPNGNDPETSLSHSRSVDSFWLAEVRGGGLPPPVQPPPPLPPSLQSEAKGLSKLVYGFRASVDRSGVISIANNEELNTKSPEQSLNHLTRKISAFSMKAELPPKTPYDPLVVSNGNSGKAPLTRRTIKYRLLEETDGPPHSVPHSPQSSFNAGANGRWKNVDGTTPSGGGVDATKRSGIDDNGRFSIDPFDVEWSAEILRRTKNTTQQYQPLVNNGSNDSSIAILIESGEALPLPVVTNNPFFQEESAAVNV